MTAWTPGYVSTISIVLRAAGLKTSDFLANDGLHKGNPIIAGNLTPKAALKAELRRTTQVDIPGVQDSLSVQYSIRF